MIDAVLEQVAERLRRRLVVLRTARGRDGWQRVARAREAGARRQTLLGPAAREEAGDRRRGGRLAAAELRPLDVARGVEVLAERDRPPGDQRERDAIPILPGGVVDHREPLQERRRSVLAEQQAVSRLPRRLLHGVGHEHRARTGAVEGDVDGLVVEVVVRAEHAEPARQDRGERRVVELERGDVIEVAAPELSGVAEQSEPQAQRAAGALPLVDSDDRARERRLAARGDGDPRTAQEREQRPLAVVSVQVEKGELPEPLVHRLLGVVVDRGDAAAAEVQRRERLQHIAHLVARETQRHRRVTFDRPVALEVADAVLIEHDAADRRGGGAGLRRHRNGRARCNRPDARHPAHGSSQRRSGPAPHGPAGATGSPEQARGRGRGGNALSCGPFRT